MLDSLEETIDGDRTDNSKANRCIKIMIYSINKIGNLNYIAKIVKALQTENDTYTELQSIKD
jgi:hypothetical protein